MLREGNIECVVVNVRKDLALLQRNATLQPPSFIDGVSVERLLPELVPVCNFRSQSMKTMQRVKIYLCRFLHIYLSGAPLLVLDMGLYFCAALCRSKGI